MMEQNHGQDPRSNRETDKYKDEYVQAFTKKWDESID